MNYEPQDLIPILAKLTNEYTSFESTSVSYDTANILMGGILYCLNETSESVMKLPETLDGADVDLLYKKGRDLVIKKVNRTKDTYHALVSDFNAYGVENYRATIADGIPEFFLHYDPKFKPQDHILTLDYPTLYPVKRLTGIDLMYYYVESIAKETQLLHHFDENAIRNLLSTITRDYENLYMDNICYPILFVIVFCFIADKPAETLSIKYSDTQSIENFFEGKSPEEISAYAKRVISFYCKEFSLDSTYFSRFSKDFSLRYKGMLSVLS